MEKLEAIRNNNHLRNLLLAECDIYFYDHIREVQFSDSNEEYSLACQAFAQDGSGGEFVILEDQSVGFIGSEGQVGRVAESLDDLLTFLIHAGSISDFSCRLLYQNKDLLAKFCQGFIKKVRDNYRSKGEDWDKVRAGIAKKLRIYFNPDKLEELAMNFYKTATRTPLFTCTYYHGDEEYSCDSVLSDIIGLWVLELVGMTREEIMNYTRTGNIDERGSI